MNEPVSKSTASSSKAWLVPASKGIWLIVTIALLWTAFARGGIWWAAFLCWIPLNLMLMAAWKDRKLEAESPEEWLEE